jgi:hypothetical protein
MVKMKTFIDNNYLKSAVGGTYTAKRVSIETPTGGDFAKNQAYCKICMSEAMLIEDESPINFSLIYSQCLNDDDDIERNAIIKTTSAWQSVIDKKIFYIDRGLSNGMVLGYLDALRKGISVEFRTLSIENAFLDIVRNLNNKIQLAPELELLSKKINKLKLSSYCKDQEQGDANGFRQNMRYTIDKIKELDSLMGGHDLNYERACVRNSILHNDEAAISLKLLYNQVISQNDAINTHQKEGAWSSIAESHVTYTNRQDNKDSNKLAKGHELRVLEVNPFSHDYKIIRSLNEKNKRTWQEADLASFA